MMTRIPFYCESCRVTLMIESTADIHTIDNLVVCSHCYEQRKEKHEKYERQYRINQIKTQIRKAEKERLRLKGVIIRLKNKLKVFKAETIKT